jgi:hypothetical protein
MRAGRRISGQTFRGKRTFANGSSIFVSAAFAVCEFSTFAAMMPAAHAAADAKTPRRELLTVPRFFDRPLSFVFLIVFSSWFGN